MCLKEQHCNKDCQDVTQQNLCDSSKVDTWFDLSKSLKNGIFMNLPIFFKLITQKTLKEIILTCSILWLHEASCHIEELASKFSL